MSLFEYTHHKETPDSSVISDLYYNANTEELVVVLHGGTNAGYDGVSLIVYLAMITHYDAREEGGSVGAYWNTGVKPLFDGFDTSWIEGFVDANGEDEGPSDWEQEVLNAQAPVNLDSVAINQTIVIPTAEYSIGFAFETASTTYEIDLPVFAVDPDDALSRFNRIAGLAGYEKVKVKSVTRFFE